MKTHGLFGRLLHHLLLCAFWLCFVIGCFSLYATKHARAHTSNTTNTQTNHVYSRSFSTELHACGMPLKVFVAFQQPASLRKLSSNLSSPKSCCFVGVRGGGQGVVSGSRGAGASAPSTTQTPCKRRSCRACDKALVAMRHGQRAGSEMIYSADSTSRQERQKIASMLYLRFF